MSTARTSSLGDSGEAVRQIVDLLQAQGLLHGEHPTYDEDVARAVRGFQQDRGLRVDGVVGPATFVRLHEARWHLGDRILTHLPGHLIAGDDVYSLQQRLLELGFATGRVDGYFGAQTESAVRDFQRNIGVPADGTCGPATLQALQRLSPLVRGGSPNAMRAEEHIRAAGPHLSGKTVVIDPHGGGHLADAYAAEGARLVADLAQRIVGRLVAIGVRAYLCGALPTEYLRADFANRAAADLVVSLGVEASDSPEAAGVGSYYFGSAQHGTYSTVGERLASLIQREMVARTDSVDLRCHAKTWELLRRTRMPAVRTDVGYLSNETDRGRLRDPNFRDVLAEAVVVGVQRFYLPPEQDSGTGRLQLSELRARLAAEG